MSKNKNYADVANGLFTQATINKTETIEAATLEVKENTPISNREAVSNAVSTVKGQKGRPLDADKDSSVQYKRQSYEISEENIQALSVFAAKNSMSKSQALRQLIEKYAR